MRLLTLCGAVALTLTVTVAQADQPRRYYGENTLRYSDSRRSLLLKQEPARQYFGVFASDAQFTPELGSKEDAGNLNFKLGYDFNKFIAVEGHAGMNINDTGKDIGSPEVVYLAGFLRANIPLPQINIYGLLGIATVDVDFAGSAKGDYTGLAYGAGIELYGTERTALAAEYVQYGTDDKYQTIGLGLVHHFNWPSTR